MVLAVVTLAFSLVVHDVQIYGETVVAMVATLLLGAGCFCCLGLTITAIAEFFPVKHFANAVQTAFHPNTSGMGFSPEDLGVMAI